MVFKIFISLLLLMFLGVSNAQYVEQSKPSEVQTIEQLSQAIFNKTSLVKEAKMEEYGIRKEYIESFSNAVGVGIKTALVDNLEGCFRYMRGNLSITAAEENFFSMELVKDKVSVITSQMKDRKYFCNSLINEPIKISCIEKISSKDISANSISNLDGALTSYKSLLAQPNQSAKNKIGDINLSATVSCHINDDLKEKNIGVLQFEFSNLLMNPKYIIKEYENLQIPRKLFVTEVSVLPITELQNKSINVYAINIEKERVAEFKSSDVLKKFQIIFEDYDKEITFIIVALVLINLAIWMFKSFRS